MVNKAVRWCVYKYGDGIIFNSITLAETLADLEVTNTMKK